MNFFEHQAKAKSASRWLVVLFLLAVGAIVVAINGVVLVLVAMGDEGVADGAAPVRLMEVAPQIVFWTTVATLAVILLATLYKTARLAGGGSVVARSVGGTLVP